MNGVRCIGGISWCVQHAFRFKRHSAVAPLAAMYRMLYLPPISHVAEIGDEQPFDRANSSDRGCFRMVLGWNFRASLTDRGRYCCANGRQLQFLREG